MNNSANVLKTFEVTKTIQSLMLEIITISKRAAKISFQYKKRAKFQRAKYLTLMCKNLTGSC